MQSKVFTILFIIWVVMCVFMILNQFYRSNLRRDYPEKFK
jgi:heme/copper-type cytochrome/quinol oxidase subunit 2